MNTSIQNNTLHIQGLNTVDIAQKYGTPLYVVDINQVRKNCYTFKSNFKSEKVNTEVIYASKAFLNVAMCQVIKQQQLSLDVVSGGELYTAIKANFPPNKIYFHGNNKTTKELILALDYGIKCIIVDNMSEMKKLHNLCAELDTKIDIMFRVNPGISAHTHEYIQTANHESKFGISIYHDDICNIINEAQESYYLNLKGFHCHIGSQILDENSYVEATKVMFDFVKKIDQQCHYTTETLNFGGGFGINYSKTTDEQFNLSKCLNTFIKAIDNELDKSNLQIKNILIEPGRSIIGDAGVTLYTIGAVKETYAKNSYIFIDGGMTDNPRYALYNSIYRGSIANKANDKRTKEYTIAGKCCESGDVLIKNIKLPAACKNDIFVIFDTGAYNYSMASNYNRIRKPAVLFIEDNVSKIVVKRETYDDILSNDLSYV